MWPTGAPPPGVSNLNFGPGQTIRVHVEGDPSEDTATDRYWGMTSQILNNSGDAVRLSTYNDIEIACTAYGDKSC